MAMPPPSLTLDAIDDPGGFGDNPPEGQVGFAHGEGGRAALAPAAWREVPSADGVVFTKGGLGIRGVVPADGRPRWELLAVACRRVVTVLPTAEAARRVGDAIVDLIDWTAVATGADVPRRVVAALARAEVEALEDAHAEAAAALRLAAQALGVARANVLWLSAGSKAG